MEPLICALCKREVHELTAHHLIPRTRHKNKRNKKLFSRKEVRERTALLCRPCHNTIHDSFSEKELERHYNTLEMLRQHPKIAKFIEWIANKPKAFSIALSRSQKPGGTH